ncbi:MAG: hypothetical protein NC402_01535 [Prevotella sp.]|nr:hypothetical protein [Prevotella sp.]MCM1074547.1 hypothetical protein [Ruminococcus sp.]
MTRHLLIALAIGFIVSASAAEIDFTLNTDNLPLHSLGFEKAETYDVAIRIDEPSVKGTNIKGITVTLPGDAISGCSGRLSNELHLKRINGKYFGRYREPGLTQLGMRDFRGF